MTVQRRGQGTATDRAQTYIGHVLVSVNPFRDLGIYTEQVLDSYKGKNRLEVWRSRIPHTRVADTARCRHTSSPSPSPPTTT